MGSGGLKASGKRSDHEPWPAALSSGGAKVAPGKSQFAPVLQAASREVWVLVNAELDAAMDCLVAAEPAEATTWFDQWFDVSQPKAVSGLVALLQRLIGSVLDIRVAAAEAAATEVEKRSDGVVDVGRMVEVCEEQLLVTEEVHRKGMLVAAGVLASFCLKTSRQGDYIVPCFDRLVRIFHRSFIAHMDSAPRNLQRWNEMETEAGLPPIEEYPQLLSITSRGAMLSLMLIPDGASPLQVVVSRETALADFAKQLPGAMQPCVLQPYFESSTGTKMIQGKRVEGGEGHGPRKEFFSGVSADALRKWGTPASAPRLRAFSREASGAAPGASCRGNRVTLADLSNLTPGSPGSEVYHCLISAAAGDHLTLDMADGVKAERTITMVLSPGTFTVDKPFEGAAQSERAAVTGCQVRKPVWPILEYHRATGEQWFAVHSNELTGVKGDDLRTRCAAFGKLLALTIVNRCKLSFSLPTLFFHALLHGVTPELPSLPPEFAAGLEDLRGFDDQLHKSLKKSLKMKAGMFKQLKEMEGFPAHFGPEDYVAQQVSATLMPQAMHEIRRGFWSVAQEDRLQNVSAEDLRQWICPLTSTSNASIRDIFHIVMEDEMAEVPVFVAAFHATLDSLSVAEKRSFLCFVTGVEAAPEPGTEQLTVQLPFSAFTQKEHEAMLGMLPQAHTCSNTLELPNYYEALLETGEVDKGDEAAMEAALRRVLGQRLRVAIREASGYELDTLGGGPTSERDDAGTSMPQSARSLQSVGSLQELPVSPGMGSAAARRVALPPIVYEKADASEHASRLSEAVQHPRKQQSGEPQSPPGWRLAPLAGERPAHPPPPLPVDPSTQPPAESSAGASNHASRDHRAREVGTSRESVDRLVTDLETTLEERRPAGDGSGGSPQPPGTEHVFPPAFDDFTPPLPPRLPSAPDPPQVPPPRSLPGGRVPSPHGIGRVSRVHSSPHGTEGDFQAVESRVVGGHALPAEERSFELPAAGVPHASLHQQKAVDMFDVSPPAEKPEHDVDILLQELGLA